MSDKAREMGMDDSRIRRALGLGVNNLLPDDLAESLDAWKSLCIHAFAYDHPGCSVVIEGFGGLSRPDAKELVIQKIDGTVERSSLVKNQKGSTTVDFAVVIIVLLGVVGWVLNIVKLVELAGGDVTAMFVLRIVGIFVGPLGCILGYL